MTSVPLQLRHLPALIVLLLLYGCGGSGSSGFDAAFFLEQDAIDDVTEGGGCADVDGTVICAPDEDLGPPIKMANLPEALVIDPSSGTGISCVQTNADESCVFNLSIQQANFPEGVQFFAAVRFQDETSFWSIELSPFAPSIDDSSTLERMVRVSRLMPGETALMQLAILVYLPESLLPSPATGVQLLRDFKVDRVYVVKDVTVTATIP